MRYKIYPWKMANFTLLVPYSREQKHVLLFRKSEILLFKVSIPNMPHIFFMNKTFLFLKIQSWNFQHLIDLRFRESSQKFSSFGQLLFFGAHVTNWIQIQLVTWGVTNCAILRHASARDYTICTRIEIRLHKTFGWVMATMWHTIGMWEKSRNHLVLIRWILPVLLAHHWYFTVQWAKKPKTYTELITDLKLFSNLGSIQTFNL